METRFYFVSIFWGSDQIGGIFFSPDDILIDKKYLYILYICIHYFIYMTNILSISDIYQTIENPYDISGERCVGYGNEEYREEKRSNPEIKKPDIDYLNGGRYLYPGFPYNLWNNPYEEKDMMWGWFVKLTSWEQIGVVNTSHFITMNGKRYRIVNLENGTRVLLDGMMYQEGRTWDRENCSWLFQKLSGKAELVDIWSDDFWVWKDHESKNWFYIKWWNAKFGDGTFGIVNETGHREILMPLRSWPRNIDRILWVTKIQRDEKELEGLIWDETGVPMWIAKIQIDTLKFIQLLQELA